MPPTLVTFTSVMLDAREPPGVGAGRTQIGFSSEYGERWVDDTLEQLSEIAGR